ncbi:MAG: hypothetical protein OZ921_01590, partial [Sorangiineae bacterium]|nr:hypothetical protein [Sorangiineae bacterium]
MSGRVTLMALAGGFASLIPSLASAATYQVGPTRTYRDLGAIAALVSPGDVVEVDGGATYPAVRFTRPGDAGAKITIRGLKVGGRRPILNGGTNTIDASADHYVFEGLEITGGGSRCFFHHADDITIRDSVIHDCPKQGLLGADNDSGSLLLEYSEFYGSGGGDRDHQIYMATDESAHPGAVFRMQFCYVHDGNGGNNVKSRAERNEIYYNWIEGAYYHELELIGPDPDGGVSASLRREDSDVVGNVLVKRRDFSFVRVGGDGTGETNGRYRFVNNTFIGFGSGSTAFRIFDGVDSVEMHNNVFWRDGGAFNITRTAEASWVAGEQIAGQNNFVVTGAGAVPSAWTSTITGASPGFIDASRDDFRPAAGSALVDEGALPTTSPPGHEFPAPLPRPLFHPPRRTLIAPGTAEPRPDDGALDIGAYELAGGPGTPDGGVGGSGGASSGGASSGGASSGGASSGGASSGGASSGGASSGGASSGGASSGGASSGGASSGGASSGGA